MTTRIVQTPAVALYAGCGATDTTMRITPYPVDLDGVKLTIADFGTTPSYTIDPKIFGLEEICNFTAITDNGDNTATLTGITRNLNSKYPYTAGTPNKLHGASAVVVFSDNPQVFNNFTAKDNNESILGSWLFPVPVTGSNAATKDYVDSLYNGGSSTTDRLTVTGTAGANVTAGKLVYLDIATATWKLTSGSTASTVDNVVLGIAQGTALSGANIPGGVLLQGRDSNQSSLTANAVAYASNTSGLIASSAGTTSIAVGIAITTTSIYFQPRYNTTLTALEKAFLQNLSTNTITATAGQALTVGDAVYIAPTVTASTVSFISVSTAQSVTASSSTYAYTVSGTAPGLLITVRASGGDLITGVTYAGTAMVQLGKIAINGGAYMYTYGLVNPTAGSNNVVISASGSTTITSYATLYAGVYTFNSFVTGSSATPLTITDITSINNSWLFASAASSSTSLGAGAGTTLRTVAGDLGALDSNAGITPAGSSSLIINASASTIYAILVIISPAPTAGAVYKASAQLTQTSNGFVGFVLSTVAVGATVTIVGSGGATITGILPGIQYYLSNTFGAVSSSAGTISKKVGIGISSTKINVVNII